MKLVFNDYAPNEVIKIIREWTELSQKDFGKAIGKSERTIQDYESGRRRYNVETLKKITQVYNVKIVIEKR